jgi:hypothetical protein
MSRVFYFGRRQSLDVVYLALSDTPVQVGADDVEEASRPLSEMEDRVVEKKERMMVQAEEAERAALKAAELKRSGVVSPPSRRDKLGIRNGELEIEDEEQSKPSRLWLYVALSLCVLFPILYFLRRKLKTGN